MSLAKITLFYRLSIRVLNLLIISYFLKTGTDFFGTDFT